MIQAGFYLLTAIMIALISFIILKAENRKRSIPIYGSIILTWILYIILISRTGILNDMGLPPKVPLFVVLPIIFATVITVSRKSFYGILLNTPLHLPVLMQSFRIAVEILIFSGAKRNIFPGLATPEGLNFDIIIGLSSIAVAIIYYKYKPKPIFLLLWNILGLAILSLTVISFVYAYYFTDFLKLNPAFEFVQVPYLFLPSVLMPCAVFLHLFSIKQISLLKKKSVTL